MDLILPLAILFVVLAVIAMGCFSLAHHIRHPRPKPMRGYRERVRDQRKPVKGKRPR